MKSYSERHIFSGNVKQAFELATYLVDSLEIHKLGGQEIRCHELARAISKILTFKDFDNTVVDGSLWCIEHTWIVLGDGPYGKILDVYVPGRMPQVQLIDIHFAITRGYEPGTQKFVKVDQLHEITGLLHEPLKKWRL